jgi:Uma2 family endonuclease
VATIILTMLSNFEQGRSLGFSFDSECGYQIFGRDQKNVRFPDGSFVARGKFPGDILPLGYARVVPDLVFEVVSPNDLAEEVDQKVEDYLQVGVRLIWVVYPATRRVVVFRPEGRAARLGGAQEITGEDVLPGFSCRVEQFFAGIGT